MTEWFVSCNPKKYDSIKAFRELGTIDWRQSTNVAADDTVYIYVSGDIAAVKFKCRANKVDISDPDIDDSKYDLSGEFDGSYGRYMELEMIEELQGSLYGRSEMEKHGFGTPQSPVRVPAEVKEYLDIVQALQHSEELDPDKHDGCYEFMREIIRSYSYLNDYSQIDYKDLNLVFFSCAGTWRYGFDKKKRDIQESHLPQTEKDRLLSVFESIYNKAQNSFYDNENDKQPSIGMFGVGFRSFLGKADEESSRKFIKMCVEISQMQDDEKAFDRCAEVLTPAFRGMRSAAASVTLHTLRPTVFPILNRNGGHGNIFTYFGLPLRRIANLETYVENCRIIKDFRDNNFNIRNYRVFDLVARELSLSDPAEDIDMDDVEFKGAENMNSKYGLNTILYGPPGTGKTYNTVKYAVSICDGIPVDDLTDYDVALKRYDELKKEGRIAFTTFHQSYGYEEFIEGIKPQMDGESNSVGYDIKNGIFKDFCKKAKEAHVEREGSDVEIKDNPKIWGMLLGGTGTTKIKTECFNNGEIRLGWSEVDDTEIDGDFIGDDKVSWNGKHMVFDFKNTMEVGDIVLIESSLKSIDAIGVVAGDYEYDSRREDYPRSRKVKWLVKDIDQDIVGYLPGGRKQLSRFSLFSCDYIGIEAVKSILEEHNADVISLKYNNKPFVFIIDEINRGNISKIFGELITLIEPTKRAWAEEEMETILPYSGEAFNVPSNVYILGTMNTADRSIALMDTALRRRFDFVEMMPDIKVIEGITVTDNGETLDVPQMLKTINERIEYLYDREHTIGHAFFTGLSGEKATIENLASIFRNKVIPLLQEYFYEDYEKIQLVLGDNEKSSDKYKFILDSPAQVKKIFKNAPQLDLREKMYEIQEDAFNDIRSYIEITEMRKKEEKSEQTD